MKPTRGQAPRRRRLLAASLALLVLGAAAAVIVVERAGVAPRQLGPYLAQRASGHQHLVSAGGSWLGAQLVRLDRGRGVQDGAGDLRLGAQDAPAGSDTAGRIVLVGNPDELRTALARAEPGDAITLLPGRYRIAAPLAAGRPGSEAAPIVVRARRPGSVTLEQEGIEGFRISAPYWRFENLVLRGTCADDAGCEHAFHVAGAAHHVALVNNTVVDFNAHIKINGEGGQFPDHGLAEANTLTNTHARRTANPVTPVDLVAASGWTIRRNLISDFVKAGGNGVSYGAFAKGGGTGNVFEQNLVWCERRLSGAPGQRIGLSFGGGGTGKAYCRDRTCVVEQQGSTMRSNLVAGCSDVGIYLNNAAQSSILHNSVIDTAGVDVRFPGSSADLEGNLVDGAIRSRNGGVVRARDNLDAAPIHAYLGYHPVRALYATQGFGWRGAPVRREGASGVPADLCGQARAPAPAYGAFEDFAACLAPAAATSAAPATSSSSAAN